VEEFCPYLKEKKFRNLSTVIYCSIDDIILYRKCCPPSNVQDFYICYQNFKSCKKIKNLETKIN